jgi:phosphoribosyl 1,2-cyclic phosphodiesterase
VRAHLLGVRGSVPAPGPPFVRYGGNTSCVALARDGQPPTLLLDAGTGLRGLPALLEGPVAAPDGPGPPFRGTLLLTHLHWDHVGGLPFCPAIDRPDARCDLLLPAQPDGTGAEEVLARMMSPPNFPIAPDGLLGQWTFASLPPGTTDRDGWTVTAAEIAHKGGLTFGYRIEAGGSSLAYLPDHCPTDYGPGPEGWGAYPSAVVDLVAGVDLLVHDAQFTAGQLPEASAVGHAAVEYAVALGRRAGAGTVVLSHHSPARTDAQLDGIADRYRAWSEPAVLVAAEGTVLQW